MQRVTFISGIALFAWQIVAGVVAATGQAETLLGGIDPGWWATLWAVLLSPPRWLVWIALMAGAALIAVSEWKARAQRRRV